MPLYPAMLAQEDPGLQLLYVIAILILTAGGAIFEKIKQKQSETQRRQRRGGARPSRPPRRPVETEGEFHMPPAMPPIEPPVARPSLPRRPPRESQVERPRRRPRPALETPPRRARPARRETPTPAPSSVPTASGGATGAFERQISGVSDGRVDAPQSALSLEQLRARERGRSSAADTAAFGRPTVAELRRAIVLSEILAPPVGLREE